MVRVIHTVPLFGVVISIGINWRAATGQQSALAKLSMDPKIPLTGRGHRTIWKSQKALEADGFIPGINNAPNLDSSPFSGPVTPVKPAVRPNPPPQPNRPAQSEPPTQATTMKRLKTSNTSLGPLYLKIYEWETPTPTDFLNLTDSRKQWKANMDMEEGDADVDDEIDNWNLLAGREEDYQTFSPNMTLRFSIARTFISRAKRAFRARRTWQNFELEELGINSSLEASAVATPEKRALALRECLDNNLRLKVFDDMKERLCNEIWLQEYTELAVIENGDVTLKARDSFIDGAAAGQAKGKKKVPVHGGESSNPCDREVPEGPQSAPVKATAMNMQGLGLIGENGYPELIVSESEDEET
ncbi:hypothetical protein B0A48_07786 [Cryoendolithus antarcticus]|uniref:Uncharacterized protein n=1 Tax=Cryoendolithus antarcticus TaxID=1507870 RepID=A0A1V8T727_9PEZI|nr:hypothetical protein B0A48_07786 [Cryoendolithus antarcticus]